MTIAGVPGTAADAAGGPVGRPSRREQLATLIRRYQRDTDAFDQAVAERLGLNRTDLRCLDVLLEEVLTAGTVTPSRLATLNGLTASTTTSVLDRLEAAGYVRRVRDPENRRQVFVELTTAFVSVTTELFGAIAQDAAAQLAGFTDAELDVLISFFDDAHERRLERTRLVREATAHANATETREE